MVNFTLLAGGSGAAFVATYLFNPDAASLTLTHKNPTGENPSWIGAHPTNSSVIYAVNEVEAGMMQSFVVGTSGVLSAALANISSGGNGPAHLQALSTGEVSIMNFGGGNGRIIEADAHDPAIFSSSGANITFQATKSNPHETAELSSGELLVPDLGADKIWRLKKSKDGSFSVTGSIAQPTGSGPRHVAILGDILLTLHETGNTLTSQNLSATDPSAVISSLSVIPSTASKTATFGAGEILLPPKSDAFPTQFIYCSNRNVSPNESDLDPKGDTIAIFSMDAQGKLKLENQVVTGIRGPRGLAFSGSPANATTASSSSSNSTAAAANSTRAATIHGAGTAEFLAIGGQAGDGGVVIMRRTDGGKNLVEVAREKTVATRTSFVWV